MKFVLIPTRYYCTGYFATVFANFGGVPDPNKKSHLVHENLRRMLRKLREDRGWSQTRMAAESGLGRKAISFIEDGERQPKLDTLIRMTGALDAPLSDLLEKAGW